MKLQKYLLQNGKPVLFGDAEAYRIQDHTWLFREQTIGLIGKTDFEKDIMNRFLQGETALKITYEGMIPSINPILGFLFYNSELNKMGERTRLVDLIKKQDETHLFYTAQNSSEKPDVLTFSPTPPSNNYSLANLVPIEIGPYEFRGQKIELDKETVYRVITYTINPETEKEDFVLDILSLESFLLRLNNDEKLNTYFSALISSIESSLERFEFLVYLSDEEQLNLSGEEQLKSKAKEVRNTLELFRKLEPLL